MNGAVVAVQGHRSVSYTHLDVYKRQALGLELAEGRLGKDLARLLSAERLFHALAAAPGGENFAFVFFLPFLRGADLFAAWAKITDEGKTCLLYTSLRELQT